MTELLLIRHCASSAQHPEAPLTAAGAEAADRLADWLGGHGIDAVYSSPYARAVATIAPFAERAGLGVAIEPRLRERLLSPMPLDDFREHIRRSFDDLDHCAPGGESLRETGRRALAALGEIALKGHALAAAASHGNAISAVLRSVDPRFGFDQWAALRNPDVFRLTFEGARLVSYRPLTMGA